MASKEYSQAVSRDALADATIVDVVFKDGGRILGVYAKRARGLIARFCAESDAKTLDDVRKFNLEGYTLDEKASDGDRTLVFSRAKPEAAPKARTIKAKAKEESVNRWITGLLVEFTLCTDSFITL